MNRLPEQKELILRLVEAYRNKGLTLNKLMDMMPDPSSKLGKTTCQRMFHRENSEDYNYDYNTLIVLSNILLDEDSDDLLLKYKLKVIEMLEAKNNELEAKLEYEKAHYHEKLEKERAKYNQIIDFRTSRISRLDDLLDEERKANREKDELIKELIRKCDNCAFHKKE